MAPFVYTDASLTAGTAWTGTAPGGASTPSGTHNSGTDLSSYVRSVSFTGEAETQDSTNMGSGGFRAQVVGLKGGTLNIEFNEDVADNLLDEIWYGYFGSTVYFDLKADSAARGASNPSIICAAIVTQYGLGGGVGELATKSVTLTCTGAWARVTS
jgi:hypothetical protein